MATTSIVAGGVAFGQQENAESPQQESSKRASQSRQAANSSNSQTSGSSGNLNKVRLSTSPSAKAISGFNEYKFKKHGAIPYFTDDDVRLTLDVYVPEGTGPFPAVLCVHGGSWRSGTKINWIRHAWKIAKRGFVVVAINYRHAPKYKYPAQIHDCKAAVRWIRINASSYKINPDQLCGLGYSAGGHLVSLLGVTDVDDKLEGKVPEDEKEISTRLQAVAAGGAPCEFSWIEDDSRALKFWLGATRKEDPEIYRLASPTSFVTSDDPPFYFFHGETDWIVPSSSSQKLHEQLKEKGVTSHYEIHENYGHFALFSYTDSLDPVLDFFEKTLELKR